MSKNSKNQGFGSPPQAKILRFWGIHGLNPPLLAHILEQGGGFNPRNLVDTQSEPSLGYSAGRTGGRPRGRGVNPVRCSHPVPVPVRAQRECDQPLAPTGRSRGCCSRSGRTVSPPSVRIGRLG